MNTHAQHPSIPEELMTVKQAAAYAVVSEVTVRRWITNGNLEVYRAGRQLRIPKINLVEFLKKGAA